MNILDAIIKDKFEEVKKAKAVTPKETLMKMIKNQSSSRDFLLSLKRMAPYSIIAECKKKSPSKGILIEKYEPTNLARSYEEGGAAALSVLTDFKYFGGTIEDLSRVSKETTIPILRKDFIIDEYQIYEARAWGADSFLLIAGVLDVPTIDKFIDLGRSLGMEPLIESHTIAELEIALQSKGFIIGVNNRNLTDFNVNLNNSVSAVEYYLNTSHKTLDRIFVCESGMNSHEDIHRMKNLGFSAFLVGESLVKSEHPAKKIRELKGLID